MRYRHRAAVPAADGGGALIHRPDPVTLNLPQLPGPVSPSTYRLVPLGFLKNLDQRLAIIQATLYALLLGVVLLALLVGLR